MMSLSRESSLLLVRILTTEHLCLRSNINYVLSRTELCATFWYYGQSHQIKLAYRVRNAKSSMSQLPEPGQPEIGRLPLL
jgi:hypothetical protein